MIKRLVILVLAAAPMAACGTAIPEEELEKRQNAEAWIEAGFNAFRQGRFEAAASFYKNALTLTPDGITALLGYADSLQEWSEQVLEQAMRLFNAGRTGGPEELQRSLQTVNPMISKAVDLQNQALYTYGHIRQKFADNHTAYMKATFGFGKLYYYRIISPHSVYSFAELEEKEQDGNTIKVIKDPIVREQLIRDREEAVKYLTEFVDKAGDQAIEARRWLAAMLVARNQENDRRRALDMLRTYSVKLQDIRKNAEKSISDPQQLKVYLEFIDRELRTTKDAIAMLESGR